ncbi:MAG: DUF4124 domain-containing protein [Gammaproteobacteria bacterium]|nr:DUF4124 domain-containing protein [Gammaproteobacteria bacterium]
MIQKHFILISLIVLFPSTAFTGIYKWTDADGKVHYSQQKPADSQTEKLSVSGGHKPGYAQEDPDPAAKKTGDETGQTTENTEQAPTQTTQEEPAPPKKSKSACKAAKKNLQQIQSTGRVRKRNSNGDIIYLSDKQKQAEIKKAKLVIKKNC